MEVTDILSRLSKVRGNGPGKWMACCPAHEDRTPSLSVRDADGRILLRCFGGCETGDVLAALGLSFSDLFAEPLTHRARPLGAGLTAMDALRSIEREAGVLVILASDIAEKKTITDEEAARAAKAAGRIAEVLERLQHGR